MEHIYSASYKKQYFSFADFLFAALNQKIKLNTNDPAVRQYCSLVFTMDTAVALLYKKEGIEGLLHLYTLPEKSGYTLKQTNLTLAKINSVSFFFFLHQLIRLDDDYNAAIHFIRLSSVLNNTAEN